MIANLPAKRATRRVVGFDEVDIKTRSQSTIQNSSMSIGGTSRPRAKQKNAKNDGGQGSSNLQMSAEAQNKKLEKDAKECKPPVPRVTDYIDTSAENGNVLSSLRMMPVARSGSPVSVEALPSLSPDCDKDQESAEDGKKYMCTGCGLKFESLSTCKRHRKECVYYRESKPNGSNACKTCGQKFGYLMALLEHTCTGKESDAQMPTLEIERDLAPVESPDIPVLSPVAERDSLKEASAPIEVPKDNFICGISFVDGVIKYETVSSVSKETEKLVQPKDDKKIKPTLKNRKKFLKHSISQKTELKSDKLKKKESEKPGEGSKPRTKQAERATTNESNVVEKKRKRNQIKPVAPKGEKRRKLREAGSTSSTKSEATEEKKVEEDVPLLAEVKTEPLSEISEDPVIEGQVCEATESENITIKKEKQEVGEFPRPRRKPGRPFGSFKKKNLIQGEERRKRTSIRLRKIVVKEEPYETSAKIETEDQDRRSSPRKLKPRLYESVNEQDLLNSVTSTELESPNMSPQKAEKNDQLSSKTGKVGKKRKMADISLGKDLIPNPKFKRGKKVKIVEEGVEDTPVQVQEVVQLGKRKIEEVTAKEEQSPEEIAVKSPKKKRQPKEKTLSTKPVVGGKDNQITKKLRKPRKPKEKNKDLKIDEPNLDEVKQLSTDENAVAEGESKVIEPLEESKLDNKVESPTEVPEDTKQPEEVLEKSVEEIGQQVLPNKVAKSEEAGSKSEIVEEKGDKKDGAEGDENTERSSETVPEVQSAVEAPPKRKVKKLKKFAELVISESKPKKPLRKKKKLKLKSESNISDNPSDCSDILKKRKVRKDQLRAIKRGKIIKKKRKKPLGEGNPEVATNPRKKDENKEIMKIGAFKWEVSKLNSPPKEPKKYQCDSCEKKETEPPPHDESQSEPASKVQSALFEDRGETPETRQPAPAPVTQVAPTLDLVGPTCSEDVTLVPPTRSLSPDWNQQLWESSQSTANPSLGTILDSVNKLLNEPESTTYTPLPQYSLADLQKAMGASDAEMAVLQQLGEASLQDAMDDSQCKVEDEWNETCIMDLDNQHQAQDPPLQLTAPLPPPPPSTPQPQVKEEPWVREKGWNSLLAAHSGKEVVCPTCSSHFMGFPALQVHVSKAHSDLPHPAGLKPKARRSSLTVHKQDLTTLNRRVVLESAKESRLICFVCQQILPSNLMCSHLVVDHSLKSADITKCSSISGDNGRDEDAVGGERLKSKMSSALGDLLDRAVNNLLSANRCTTKQLAGGAVQLLAKLCAIRKKDGASQHRLHPTARELLLRLKQEVPNTEERPESPVPSRPSQLHRPFSCAICGQKFTLAATRNQHVVLTHTKSRSEDKYEMFEYENDWREAPSPTEDSGPEMSDTERKKPVHPLCSDCGLSFRSIQEMMTHRIEYHRYRRSSTESVLTGCLDSPSTISRRSSVDASPSGCGCNHPTIKEINKKTANLAKEVEKEKSAESVSVEEEDSDDQEVVKGGPRGRRRPGRPRKNLALFKPRRKIKINNASKKYERKKVRLTHIDEVLVREKAEAALRELNHPKKNKESVARWAHAMTFTKVASSEASDRQSSPRPDVYDFSEEL